MRANKSHCCLHLQPTKSQLRAWFCVQDFSAATFISPSRLPFTEPIFSWADAPIFEHTPIIFNEPNAWFVHTCLVTTIHRRQLKHWTVSKRSVQREESIKQWQDINNVNVEIHTFCTLQIVRSILQHLSGDVKRDLHIVRLHNFPTSRSRYVNVKYDQFQCNNEASECAGHRAHSLTETTSIIFLHICDWINAADLSKCESQTEMLLLL